MPIPSGRSSNCSDGLEQARREAGRVQQPPEVVAGVREVGVRGVREAAGVDAAEDDGEPRREDVRDGGGVPGPERRLCGFGLARFEPRLEREPDPLGQRRRRRVDSTGSPRPDDLDGVLAPRQP